MSKLVVVIDMQNDFIDGALGSEAAQSIVPKAVAAIEHYSNSDNSFCVTLDTHGDDYFNTLEGKLLPVPHCMMGTEGIQLNNAVAHVITDNFLGFTYINSKDTFGYNWFNDRIWFHKEKFDEIIIFGLCTDICVVSNALILRAACPDIPIKCLAYCCAGTTPDAHEAALKVMESCQIEVIREEGEY